MIVLLNIRWQRTRKGLSVLLSAALAAALFLPVLYLQAADSTVTYHVDFENYPADAVMHKGTPQEGGNYCAFSVSDDTAQDGSKSLKYMADNLKQGAPAHAALYDQNGDLIKLKSNRSYVVSFWYNSIASTLDDFTGIRFGTTEITHEVRAVTNGTSTIENKPGGHHVNKWNSARGSWAQQTTIYNTGTLAENQENMVVSIYKALGTSLTGTTYVDNIQITEIAEGNNYFALENIDGEGSVAVYQGTEGDPTGYTPPTREGYVFDGWHTERLLNKPYTGSLDTFPSMDSFQDGAVQRPVLVAKWKPDNAKVDFEDYQFIGTGAMCHTNAAEPYSLDTLAHGGSASLKCAYPADADGKTQTTLAPLGEGIMPLRLNANKKYVITFYYQVAAIDSKMRIGLYTRFFSQSNVTNPTKASSAIEVNAVTDGWVRHQFVVETGTFSAGSQSNNEDALYLGVNAPEGSGTATIYFDDFTITEVAATEKYVQLEMNDGTDTHVVLHGEPGAPMDLSGYVTARPGFRIEGWYTDKACTTSFSSVNAFPAADTTLYAKWVEAEGVQTVTFENSPATGFGDEAFSISGDVTHGGAKALKYTMDAVADSEPRYAALHDGADYIRLEPGRDYVVSFWYNVSLGTPADAVKLQFSAGKLNGDGKISNASTRTMSQFPNRWGNVYESKRDSVRGVWAKHICILKTGGLDADANMLLLDVRMTTGTAASQGTVYVDDVSVTRIDDGNGYFVQDLNDDQGSVQVYQCPVGDETGYQEPTRAGFVFDGWGKNPLLDDLYTGRLDTMPAAKDLPDLNGVSIPIMTARWKAAGKAIGFEDYPYIGTSAIRCSTAASPFSLSTAEKHGGAASLAYRYAADAGKDIQYAPLNAGGAPLRINGNRQYIVSLYYKTGDVAAPMDIGLYTTRLTQPDDNVKPQTTNNLVTGAAATDGWVRHTFTFTTAGFDAGNGTNNNDALFIGVKSTADSGGSTVYFDDITITEVNKDDVYVIAELNDVSDTQVILQGAAGAAMSLPTPAKQGFRFKGWFTDKALTAPFTGSLTQLPAASTTLYAAYEEEDSASAWEVGFEDYPFTPGSISMDSTFSITTDEANSGDSSLKCLFDKVPANQYKYAALNYNAIPLRVKNGHKYVVSFYYKINSPNDSQVAVRLHTGTDKRENLRDQTVPEPGNREKGGIMRVRWNTLRDTWMRHVAVLDVKDIADADSNVLWLSVVNETIEAGVGNGSGEFYFDDFSIVEIEEGNHFIVTDGNDEQPVGVYQGAPGADIPAITPAPWDGHTFKDWYTSSRFTEGTDYTGSLTKIPQDDYIILYALWQTYTAGEEWHVGFEDYPFTGTKQADAAFEKSNTVAHSGDYSLKLNAHNNKVVLATVNDGDKPFLLKKGDYYAISYYYYVEDAGNDICVLHFGSGNPDQLGSFVELTEAHKQPGTAPTLKNSAEVGKWIYQTTVFRADFESDANNALYIEWVDCWQNITGASGMVLYLDDLTIRRVDATEGFAMLTKNDGTDEEIFLKGELGDSLTLPESLEREHYVFGSWYTNAEMTLEYTITGDEVFAEEPLFLLAKWHQSYFEQGFETCQRNGVGDGLDLDFELYKSGVEGFDAANVHGGQVSLHRVGNNMWPQHFSIFDDLEEHLDFGYTYTMSFWVKADKIQSNDDKIELVYAKSWYYPWSTDMDFAELISLGDLSDGKWHKVTHTFSAINLYAAIRTPGGSSLYFDDFVIEMGEGSGEPDDPDDPDEPTQPTQPTQPGEPTGPNNPTEPSNPDDPGTPTTPEESNPTGDTDGEDEAPETGVPSSLCWILPIVFLSAGALLILGRKSRHYKEVK